MSEDRRRRSWRDLDRQKDRSQHRRDAPGEGGLGTKRRERSQKSYRAQLDRLFDSGKIGQLIEERSETEGGSDRLRLLKAIKTAEGRDAITRAIDAYVAAHELPNDVEVVAKLLEHRDETVQLDGMRRLRDALETEQPRRTRSLVGQLRLLRDMADAPEAQQLAEELIEKLER